LVGGARVSCEVGSARVRWRSMQFAVERRVELGIVASDDDVVAFGVVCDAHGRQVIFGVRLVVVSGQVR
jgi:hypothetical protein